MADETGAPVGEETAPQGKNAKVKAWAKGAAGKAGAWIASHEAFVGGAALGAIIVFLLMR